ncbi:hypothetical protein PFLUV_G00153300 [Perca fluviatilis]|uniref:Uncharacterized protein n=1 Tax=Perca fluviatilis TaxID=8168 RepID=A0A6A5DZB4_PERFL|nr:uncharacterized protein LOC120571725 [Perca fluviatilis]KAF1381377.1 hypothetical protein PFLUV_G00153300 [Perca fluviatilis]
MAAAQQREEYLKQEPFRRNAFLIIVKMVKLNSEHANIPLVDEILHSIFFLGKINKIPFSPEDILSDDEDLLNELKGHYPQPFKLYSSQLPRRSPFSCVLDMIVELTRQTHQGKRQEQEIEKEIIEKLRRLISELELGKNEPLVSSTICVSHSTKIPNAVRYYGVSMSTSGPNPGKILIAASCFSSWDSYVAGAVMTYYPEQSSKYIKKKYFDGTIILPEQHVRCQAFNLFEKEAKPPCRSCGNLFGLTTNEKKEWPYGNCAEAESVSNLLTNVVEIREQARPKAETCTEENRKRAEGSVRKELEGFVRTEKFKWSGEFYTPQRV